jgi:hypothetical protein
MILERDIERHLILKVKAVGGEVRKVSWPGHAGAPDRIVLFTGRLAEGSCFVELKRPGKLPTPIQYREHARLRAAGFGVVWFDTTAAIDRWIETLVTLRDDEQWQPPEGEVDADDPRGR